MRIQSFNVGPYRNVLNTTEVTADEDVTVLVGKNESGKTNILHALHALRPANGDRAFPRLDYPRWLQKRHQRSGEYEDAKPVQVVFELEPDDIEAVESKFGAGVLTDTTLSSYRKYESKNHTYFLPNCDEAKAMEHLLDGLDVPPGSDVGDLRTRLESESAAKNDDGESTPAAAAAAEALKRLNDRYGDANSVSQAVGRVLNARMPRFFYFDDFAQLPGTTDIAPLVEALNTGSTPALDDGQRTALALLRMGYADDELIAEDYDTRKAELQAVGAELTQDVLDYWRQNPHLRLQIDINPVPETTPRGEQIVRRELKLDVVDDRHHFTNSLDSRSSGFRWFVSFIAAFAEFESDSNVIVLLDEPGLGLHARAQDDFLRFIDERVADRHQVLFTTHSPFMVDPARLGRVRVVEDTGPDTGTKVTTADGASNDPDTLFPLQAALGYDIAQNLFVGPDNLVVEGLSDFTYLTSISEHLESIDRTGLDPRWRVLPAGGATNIPTFVALVGPSLDVTVLADGAEAKGQKLGNLTRSGLLKGRRLITPEAASGTKDADIEDLFTDGDYVTLYNAAFGDSLKTADFKGNDRIVKRIERAREKFDHGRPASYFLHNRAAVLPRLSARTLDQFEALIEEINATLSQREAP